MKKRLANLSVLFIALGFFLLFASYYIDNFTYGEAGYLLALGWFSITTGMLILTVLAVIHAVQKAADKISTKLKK